MVKDICQCGGGEGGDEEDGCGGISGGEDGGKVA